MRCFARPHCHLCRLSLFSLLPVSDVDLVFALSGFPALLFLMYSSRTVLSVDFGGLDFEVRR